MFPRHLLSFLLICFITTAWGQDSRQEKLKQQRKQLQQKSNKLTPFFSPIPKKKSALNEVEDLAVKINLRERLIRVTNEEANRLTQQINVNQRTIDRQRKALETLKADYADMIRYSYASKSGQSRLMFLFSSESFYRPTSVFNTSNSMLHFAKSKAS